MRWIFSPRSVARWVKLWVQARAALHHARTRSVPGLEFDRFGRNLGRRLILKGSKLGLQYWVNPVSSFRYFEFEFTASCLPRSMASCFDVGSPRLFSLYLAERFPDTAIQILNPDRHDLEETQAIARILHINNIETRRDGVDYLASVGVGLYDAVWSISVIEHIAGRYDDRTAMRLMYDALRPGGRLIVTVPVDRTYREDFRSRAQYQIDVPKGEEGFFFQRVYDEDALERRLLSPLEAAPDVVRWYGEHEPGRFAAYEQRWLEEGIDCSVHDPWEIATGYREFQSWSEMPGFGVCGIAITKTA